MQEIRNIAIIAHVDHGKTTLVDELLKQAGAFRVDEEVQDRIMDSDDIERERGITILSKNASIIYKGTRINIVDTPGHADFGGQVERVLGTVDGVLLLVDAFEGPMAQTRFVTQKALSMGLIPIVIVNKIDRDGCQPDIALDKVFDLFCELHATDQQLEFTHIFASARNGTCRLEMDQEDTDMIPILDRVLEVIPPYKAEGDKPLLQISSLEYSEFMGRLAVGRLIRGKLKAGTTLSQATLEDGFRNFRVQKIFRAEGVVPIEVIEAQAGDIISIAGIPDFDIGDTLSLPEEKFVFDRISVDPPSISMNFWINTSPLVGQYGGKFLTGNHLGERLERAALSDPALRIQKGGEASSYEVSGRGVMHLTILIENMRREGYEFTVGAPKVIFKEFHGKLHEPIETFKVEVPAGYAGGIIEELGKRRGEMINMFHEGNQVHLEYHIPARGLIGIRSILLALSSGYAVTQSIYKAHEPFKGEIPGRSTGTLISKDSGRATGYAMFKLDDRGTMCIRPGDEVYPGMIIGESKRSDDIIVNVVKGKQLTNVRSSGNDDNIVLSPPRVMSLEECITFIKNDEAVEVTPEALRLRKTELDPHVRKQDEKRVSGPKEQA